MPKLMSKQQSDNTALRVIQFYNKNGNSFSKTCQHFILENISKSTKVRILNRYKTTGRLLKKNAESIPIIKKLLKQLIFD